MGWAVGSPLDLQERREPRSSGKENSHLVGAGRGTPDETYHPCRGHRENSPWVSLGSKILPCPVLSYQGSSGEERTLEVEEGDLVPSLGRRARWNGEEDEGEGVAGEMAGEEVGGVDVEVVAGRVWGGEDASF